MPPSTCFAVQQHRRENTRDCRRRQHGRRQRAAAQHRFLAARHVDGDRVKGYGEVLKAVRLQVLGDQPGKPAAIV
jgi:hypothetical protein